MKEQKPVKTFEVTIAHKGVTEWTKHLIEATTKSQAEKAIRAEHNLPKETRVFVYAYRAPKKTKEEKIVDTATKAQRAVLAAMLESMKPVISKALCRELRRELAPVRAFRKWEKDNGGGPFAVKLRAYALEVNGVTAEEIKMYSNYRSHEAVRATERAVQANLDQNGKLTRSQVSYLKKGLRGAYRYQLTMYFQAAMLKHLPSDVTGVSSLWVAESAKGFVAEAVVASPAGSLAINTQCVGAGGYNIQCYHYRYLIHTKGAA